MTNECKLSCNLNVKLLSKILFLKEGSKLNVLFVIF